MVLHLVTPHFSRGLEVLVANWALVGLSLVIPANMVVQGSFLDESFGALETDKRSVVGIAAVRSSGFPG